MDLLFGELIWALTMRQFINVSLGMHLIEAWDPSRNHSWLFLASSMHREPYHWFKWRVPLIHCPMWVTFSFLLYRTTVVFFCCSFFFFQDFLLTCFPFHFWYTVCLINFLHLCYVIGTRRAWEHLKHEFSIPYWLEISSMYFIRSSYNF